MVDSTECLTSKPNLEIPASANMMASNLPSVTLLILVSMFPLTGFTTMSGLILET